MGVIAKFLELQDALAKVVLLLDVQDTHVWRFSVSGQYTAPSTYEGFFPRALLFLNLEAHLEILGARQVPFHHVAGST